MARWFVEVAILAFAATVLPRRARVAAAPFDGPLALVVVALVGQSLLAWLAGPSTGTVAWILLGLRACLLLAGLVAWTSIIRAEKRAGSRFLALGAGTALLLFGGGGLRIVGYIVIVVATAMLEWPKAIHGPRRAFGLLVALPLAALTAVDPTGIGDLGSAEIANGLAAAAQGADPAQPFARAIRVALAIFRVQLVVAFFRFLLLPVGLRTLPLARRFAVNFTLTRSIPGFLSTVTLFAVAVLGYGLHKATEARRELEATLARAADAAALLLEDRPGAAAVERARLALGPDAARAALVRRAPGAAPSGPQVLLDRPAFAEKPSARAGGLLIVEDALYLVARQRADGPEAPGAAEETDVAEIWIPVDEAYLRRLSERVLVDVELGVMRNVTLGSFVISFGSDTAQAEAPVAVRWEAPARAPRPGAGWIARKFPVSRLFVPIGAWREPPSGDRRGVVGVTVRTSLDQAVGAIRRNPSLIASNALPFLVLGALVGLIAIVEGLAVRTGRSIVQRVIDDVHTLEAGAKRIGSGDLDHRIHVEGKDELSRLASTLNTMAESLERQQAELVDKERLEADLEVARSIQQRLLPQRPPAVSGADVAGISLPSRVVGGDLFLFLPFEEGRLGLAVGDVSGKSVPAALLMSNVVAVLRAEARTGVGVDESLSRINRLIAEQIEPNRFVTLFYGVVDRPAGVVHYACAGHNPPLLLRADGSRVWLDEGGTPLGIVADRRYRSATERFVEGDVLVLYSDGLTEAESSASEEVFGTERLADAVAGARDRSASAILEATLDAVRRFSGDRPADDDRTVVVVRAT